MGAQAHTLGRPRIEVRLHIDAAGGPLLLANAPVLLKGASAINGRLVSAGGDSNVVGAAIGVDGALALGVGGRVVRAEVLDDVVLDEGVAGPAVHGEVAVALGREGAAVIDGAGGDQRLRCVRCGFCRSGDQGTYRPVPGFHPLPPTKLPVLRQFTEYLLPSPMVYWA